MLFNRVISKRVFDMMTFEERLHRSDRVSSWEPRESFSQVGGAASPTSLGRNCAASQRKRQEASVAARAVG